MNELIFETGLLYILSWPQTQDPPSSTPKCWNSRCVPPCLARRYIFSFERQLRFLQSEIGREEQVSNDS
jgi:hypothetical protein